MEEDRLIKFVKNSLETYGAVVDQPREDFLECLFPQGLADRMGFKEEQCFGFTPDYQQNTGAEYISYNSELLERFFCLIEDAGFFTVSACPSDLYLKQKGLEKLVDEKISFLNARPQLLKREEIYNPYLMFHFNYRAISEEREDGIVGIMVNEHTLSSFPALDMLSSINEFETINELPPNTLEPKPLDQIFQQAAHLAKKQTALCLTEFEKSLTRRMRRDIERLNEYYQTLIRQIRKKMDKKQLAGEEREKEESRLEATYLELQRKAADQQKRYSLNVEVNLISAQRIFVPVVSLIYAVQRKQAIRDITLTWNPLLKDLELPGCELCFELTGRVSLCDQKLHLLCPHCFEFRCPACQKQLCPVCHPHKCPKCAVQYHPLAGV